MIYDFIPKELFPYIEILYSDYAKPKSNIPVKYQKKLDFINEHYNIYLNYFSLHQISGFWRPKKIKIRNMLFGEMYDGVPVQMYNYLDFKNNKILPNNIINDDTIYRYYCYCFKTDIEYYKLKNYIIKTPENPKITLKEHIQMLFGRRCIKFAVY